MTHYVAYTRFSPQRNAGDSESCDTQEAQCAEFADAKGWALRSMHRDEGVSGKTVDRPGLQEALASLRKGDVLLVYRHDRLARNLYLSELIRRKVAALGATISAVHGDIDGNGPEVLLVRQILDAVAEFERKLISARTKAAMRTQQRAGKRLGRWAPYGFRFDPEDPKKIVPDPDEGLAVAAVLRLTLEGKSPYQVARAMDRDMPGTSRGAIWNPRTIKKIVARGT